MAWRRWREFAAALFVLGAASSLSVPALAQSAPDAEQTAEDASAGEAAPKPIIKPPRAIQTPLDYPEGGKGPHLVVLEILVAADGSVGDAIVVSGNAFFGQAAIEAAQSWRFEPATVDGKATSARIRFEVRFSPPEKEREAETPQPPAPTVEASDSPVDEQPIEEVIVTGDRPEGERQISRAEIRQLPGTFGDAFRAVETLPGVTPIVSGLPYFYVRGAPPGNVGYFLDGLRVPLLFHIAAGPSVIHPAFIETVELHAGPYPARYGRFTGGIVAGETAPPAYETRGEASIRLVDAGGMVETHGLNRNLSVMLAGRYSYTALIASLVAPDLNLSYWDYQGRVQYRLNPKESVTLFAFGALDKASEKRPGPNLTIFDLVFHRYDLRYDRHLDDGGHLRIAANFGTEISGANQFSLHDRSVGTRVELERPLSSNVELRAGVDFNVDRYTARLNEEDFLEEGVDDDDGDFEDSDIFPPRFDFTTGARADIVWEAEPGVRVIPGLRADFYVSDETPLWALSPRLYAEFDVRKNITLRHGLGVAHQLPSFVVPLPGFQPVGERGLQRAIQHSAGVLWIPSAGWSTEATVFQNIQLNITDTLSSIRFQDSGDFDLDTRALGSGRGFELLIRRSLTERLGGYFAYTFSRSTRSFGSQTGPASFDRTHVLSGALGYQIGKGWTAGLRGSFYTGIPAQEITSAVDFEHPPRTRPFYRIDWRVEKRWDVGQKGAWWALVLEVLNTTLNKEMIFLECNASRCRGEMIGPVTIPSIGVEASF